MNKALRVAFAHDIDSTKPQNSWVGTLECFKRAFSQHVGTVTDLGPTSISLFPYRIARRLVQHTTGKIYSFHHDASLARRLGGYFTRVLRQQSFDLLFVPSGSSIVAYVETDLPIILYNDATWPLLRGYYSDYSRTIDRSTRGAVEIESRAHARADALVFPTTWAAQSAIDDCGADPAKVFVVSPGPNLPKPPEREDLGPRTLGDTVRLLFVGMRWQGKGGDVAFDTLMMLLAMGVDAELTVVGCTPPAGVEHPRMHVIPFLDKQSEPDLRRFEALWRAATFLLLPSRFEAAGIVFCEASAYGVPSLGTRTGGIPSIIHDGLNGYTVPLDEGAESYARIISDLVHTPERYAALCASTRIEYETRLNWRSWGKRMAEIAAQVTERHVETHQRKLQSSIVQPR